MKTLKISKDFSKTPGHRSPEDGPYSGEEFLETKLLPFFKEILNSNEKLIVDLDDTKGYATSFLEASFGGLARAFSSKVVLDKLVFVSEDEEELIPEIKGYIEDADKK